MPPRLLLFALGGVFAFLWRDSFSIHSLLSVSGSAEEKQEEVPELSRNLPDRARDPFRDNSSVIRRPVGLS